MSTEEEFKITRYRIQEIRQLARIQNTNYKIQNTKIRRFPLIFNLSPLKSWKISSRFADWKEKFLSGEPCSLILTLCSMLYTKTKKADPALSQPIRKL